MSRQRGFTLIELMITLGVAAILLSVGVPGFRGVIMDNRMASQANQFVTSVGMARSAAVRYQRNATVCASTNYNASVPTCTGGPGDWANGWIVWVDKDRDSATDANEIISVFGPLNTASTFESGGASSFSYDSRGFGLGLAAAEVLTLCDSRTAEMGRVVSVNVAGRTNVSRLACL